MLQCSINRSKRSNIRKPKGANHAEYLKVKQEGRDGQWRRRN